MPDFDDYYTTAEFARAVQASEASVRRWIGNRQLPDVMKRGATWWIPKVTARPDDRRITADGKYKNWRAKHQRPEKFKPKP